MVGESNQILGIGKRRGPAVVCIGGGTGLSTLLRGLRKVAPNITAIVTVTDDGGGSGVLRGELGMPPPGDIRNCLLALSNAEPTIERLLSYRFSSGNLKGQSFGNLFLAAINGISESFDKAVAKMGEVLSITGRVLPVTIEDIRLWAEFEDGRIVIGESMIATAKARKQSRIKRVGLAPGYANALPECVEAIKNADLIVLGPGSLYTSIIPNLLVDGVVDAIKGSDAVKLYICNVMTEPGETEGYSVFEHVWEIFGHAGGKIFDNCLVNSEPAPPTVLNKYKISGATPVHEDGEKVKKLDVKIIRAPIAADLSSLARHDPDKLAREVLRIFHEKAPTRTYE
ncbi:MAG: YvcK family protein [Oscillospiraceae bacterium]|nr:YvcK family protein [Oscillospiraceae bacterium]